jgi:hypothetical protein
VIGPVRNLLVAVVAIAMCAGFGGAERLFAPSADLWPRWQAHDPDSIVRIDHNAWDALLETYVVPGRDGIARVAYSRMAATDMQRLDAYVGAMARVPISRYNRQEQLAYWANLYNALTVQVVATHLPVASIRDIDLSESLFSSGGPWDRKLVTVEGEKLSLNDIEHRILRPIWRDPRIHYALNCAALGCPDLRRTAWRGDSMNRALEDAARDFVNHPRGVAIENGRLIVSSLYAWYRDDFGDGAPSVLAHLRRYAGPTLDEALARFTGIDDHRYDWALNDTDRPPGG